MRRPTFIAVTLTLVATSTSAGVTVTSGNPDRFTDAGDRSTDPVKVVEVLKAQLQRLGDQYLPPGTDARIEILDLDRAGRTRMNLPTEMRIVNGKADFPCIELRYEVISGGTRSAPKQEQVCDRDFLRPLGPRESQNDPLVYEKRMLDEWFRARFAVPATKH